MSTKPTKEPAALSCRQIAYIANRVAQRYGLTRLSHRTIRSMYDSTASMPILVSNKNGHLWVDKYYVAYCLKGGPVRYAYLSWYHIDEELDSYAEASRARGTVFRIPADIRECFSIAMRRMAESGKETWNYTEEPCGLNYTR